MVIKIPVFCFGIVSLDSKKSKEITLYNNYSENKLH